MIQTVFEEPAESKSSFECEDTSIIAQMEIPRKPKTKIKAIKTTRRSGPKIILTSTT